jgi:hypothetical protein
MSQILIKELRLCIRLHAWLDKLGFDSQEGQEIFFFLQNVQDGSGMHKPPIQWVLGMGGRFSGE